MIYRSLGAKIGAERDCYSEVFDAYEQPRDEPVTGCLSDDFADIYLDLAEGLTKWNRGEHGEAVWHWRFSFNMHWGEHASGALRALHALAAWHDLWYPPPEHLRT